MDAEHSPKIRKKTSRMWNYFIPNEIDRMGKCKLCGGVYSYKSTISNLMKHLENKHPDAIQGLGSDEDPREGLREFISLDRDNQDVEELDAEISTDDVVDWSPKKIPARKPSYIPPVAKKIKTQEVISSNGVEYLIYTPDSNTKVNRPMNSTTVVGQRQSLPTPAAPPPAPASKPSTTEEDEFACFAKFLAKRLASFKDKYWQSCAINEINMAMHKVEMRAFAPPRQHAVGSDFSVQTESVNPGPSTSHDLSHHIVEEIIPHEEDV